MSENPNTELVTSHPSVPRSAALEVANRLGVKMQTMLDTVKAQCFRGGANVSESQLAAFISVCWEIGANPLIPGQIYAYPTSGGGIIPMIGPDFVLTKLGTHPDIENWETVVYPTEGGLPTHATCKIYRKGREHPLTYTAWLSEWKVTSNPNWNNRVRHMLWLRTTKQAARQVINGLPMDEDERVIMQAQIIPDEQPRLADGESPVVSNTTSRRGRRPGGILGATAGQGAQGNGDVQQAPVIETPPPEPTKTEEIIDASPAAEDSDSEATIETPKRTTLAKGDQIKGPLKIISIVSENVPQANGAPDKKRLKMQVEGEFWGTAYTYLVPEFEGKEGQTISAIAAARLLGGVPVPFITDVLPAE